MLKSLRKYAPKGLRRLFGAPPVPPTRFLRDDPALKRHSLGEWSYGRPRVLEWGEGGELSIGRFCSIAEEVTILLGGEHRTDWVSTYPFAEMTGADVPGTGHPRSKGKVAIGHDVWIGRGALILSGVTLSSGCVVGAHAVVSKSVPPYAIVAGNPARVVRMRFDEGTIAALLETAWWDWPIERIRETAGLLSSGDVGELLAQAGCLRKNEPERNGS